MKANNQNILSLCKRLSFNENGNTPCLCSENRNIINSIKEELTDLNVSKQKGMWSSKTVIKNKEYHVSLLRIDAGGTILDHDHPGSSGFALIVNGECNVRQFTKTGDRPGYKELSPSGIYGIVKKGDIVTYGAIEANIHGIKTDTGCLIMNVVKNPYLHEKRHWYLIVKKDENGVSVAKKVTTGLLEKFRKNAA